MLTLVIYCIMIQYTVTQNLRIQLILLLILLIFCIVSITHCFTRAFWYLLSITLSFIILYDVSAHSWLHAEQSQFNSASYSWSKDEAVSRGSLAALSLWKAIPLMTQQRQTAHIVVIFYSPLIYLLSCLEKKEQIVCFAEASFISHRRKRPLILSCHTSYTLIMVALLEDEKK